VIEPFVVYAPARLDEDERSAALARYRERVLALDSAPTLSGLRSADFDGLVRRTGAA
jgi:hypothetical protein